MYRKIVVGYDGTDQGRDALELAAVLRAPAGAVIAAHVYPETGHGLTAELHKAMADAALDTLAGAREQVDAKWLELRAVAGGSAAHGLHRLCTLEEPDLAIVGSSQRGDTEQVAVGSVGERLLSGSPCPVALAPKGFRDKAAVPRVVGVAYDGSDEAGAALGEAAALASELEASLRVVTVVPPLAVFSSEAFFPPQQADEEIVAARREEFRHMLEAAAEPLRAATVLLEGHPAEAIAQQARQSLDLLVMGSRSYGPIRRVMVGSTAIEVMRLAPCPVIVIPRGAATPSADASVTES